MMECVLFPSTPTPAPVQAARCTGPPVQFHRPPGTGEFLDCSVFFQWASLLRRWFFGLSWISMRFRRGSVLRIPAWLLRISNELKDGCMRGSEGGRGGEGVGASTAYSSRVDPSSGVHDSSGLAPQPQTCKHCSNKRNTREGISPPKKTRMQTCCLHLKDDFSIG